MKKEASKENADDFLKHYFIISFLHVLMRLFVVVRISHYQEIIFQRLTYTHYYI